MVKEDLKSIKEYIVSVAVDGRVDVRIKGTSVEDAESKISAGICDFDMNNVEVVGLSPVNISGPDGELIKDF